jgi:hypothetical protein
MTVISEGFLSARNRVIFPVFFGKVFKFSEKCSNKTGRIETGTYIPSVVRRYQITQRSQIAFEKFYH